MKINVANEKIKRKYLRYLKEAEGLSDSTINAMERSLLVYEEYSKQEDFGRFSQTRAIGFKKWIQDRTSNGRPISIKTIYHYLRHLRSFFKWLAGQPGYKSKIDFDSISYLTLEKKLVRQAREPKLKRYPSLEYVLKLTDSIEIDNEIDQRDRALIAFLLLTGMRDRAVSTLPLGCFDRQNMIIMQLPSCGVQTKFGKSILTTIFNFDGKLVRYLMDWAEYLEKVKLFSAGDPLFPRSKSEQIEGGYSFICRQVEAAFWAGTGQIRMILKNRARDADLEYYHPHSFRHAATHIAIQSANTIEQMKAISQNFGHEHVFTTLMTYGKLDDDRVREIVGSLDFSADVNDELDDVEEALIRDFAIKLKKELDNYDI